ncbi:TonB-dependent receptor [Psychrosphaera sp. B3R10]|uniref:TonB-dependent receptor n=1 Tax=unclassified Psychrosphaera TaxID=2641570 RepID=UPI001C083B3F|nr:MULTISPECIES: TonB-dependent receptor [unclassified Psychrosphaera]MBU2881770.1 TonB-dependent receptor [Psychrosphaera sp. I2R16]MBU2990145.1 TonB-dependent receptor [Psychrosphaera sp. B3R10]MDO6719921.1 TonB-dependent receptor [Psychrosphaera sp. 1_MG-2023]
MKTNYKLNSISAAVLGVLLSNPVYAAEPEDKNADDDIEVIEVKGFRGSLQKAVNAKRFSDNVSDSIHAEDVGKSTDQNIADALSRVTGISVIEEDGEGTRISIRGTSPSMNQISMNGVAITSGNSGNEGEIASQSVDLSSFSSDILSSIDVVKTSSAEQDEGSLGANVVLRTIKPLSLNEPRRMVNVEGRYNEFSGKYDGRVTTSFADKFADDTFGVIFTVSADQQQTRNDSTRTSWVEGGVGISDLYANSGRIARDTNGKAIRVLGFQTDSSGAYVLNEAGDRVLNDISTLVDYDPATQTVISEGEYNVLARNNTDISVASNIRERISATAGFEWEPTDSTNIQLDLTKTKQTVETDYHNFRMNFAPRTGISGNDPVLDWNTVNVETQTLERSYSRLSSGFFNRSQGTRELETDVFSFTVEQDLTDNLRMQFNVGFSETVEGTDDFISLSTATWGTLGNSSVDEMPADIIEPIGYNCLAAECDFDISSSLAVIDPYDGSLTSAPSRFSLLDLNANHLGGLTFRNNEQTDTNKSLKLDFQWELDFDYVTGVEFGIKASKRVKDVYTQNQTINTGTAVVDNSNPNVSYATTGMGSIGVVDMLSGEAFPYDNFGEGLFKDTSDFYFDGWPMLDAKKALAEFAGRDPDTVGIAVNPQGTREISTETQSAYVKLNFEGFDGRLTGNIGVRFVKDSNESSGYGGINYHRPPHLVDPYNLLIERGLGDIEGSEACPDAQMNFRRDGDDNVMDVYDTRWAPQNESELAGCFAWQLTHGYNFDNDDTIPYVDGAWVLPGGMDTNRLVFIDYTGASPVINDLVPLPNTVVDINGNEVDAPRSKHRHFGAAGEIWPFLDRSTSFVGPNGNKDNSTIRSAANSGSATHTLLLPSLNLNYAINDEMIVRFATSKTMTRPEFDFLNPRLQMNENPWGPTALGSAGNANLKPLKSTNVDISFEWYFNESGLVSAAVFHKDIVDMVENVVTPFHYKDVRTEYDLQSANLLLDYDETRMPGEGEMRGEQNCMPHRYYAGFSASEWEIECHVANINIYKNGNSTVVSGLELGYTQNYDFLPGALSGLGLSINYTYQHSEKEAEEIGTSGVFMDPLPMDYTPEHAYNATVFYELDGLSLRWAQRYTGVQLLNDGLNGGAAWQDETHRSDFSASYNLSKNVSMTFNITNVLEDTRREFYTSNMTRTEDQEVYMNEGNVFENDVTDERTLAISNTGRQFRLGIRANF